MSRKAQPLLRFDIYLVWRLFGTVEAASTQEAAEVAGKEFGKDPRRLIAVRR